MILPSLENAIMVRDKEPLFVLSIKFHELYYLVDEKDESKVIEGD